ncbi:MAG: replicative DNA helicase [bacterium]|nr:replicative DNA helicase [bacterium]
MATEQARTQTSADRVQPQAVEVEKAVLGAMLIDNGAISSVVEVLGDESAFYQTAHRKIYAAVLSLYERSEPADLVTLTEELNRRGQLESVGGAAYIAGLAGEMATGANAEYHAKIVQERALRRRLIDAATQTIAESYEDTEDVKEVIDRAEQRVFRIAEGEMGKGIVSVESVLADTFAAIERAHQNPGSLTGVTTGYTDLDEITAGLQPSDMVILAARPSMGKTALTLCMARNAAVKSKTAVLYFSLEMSVQQLVIRLLCAEARVSSHRLRTGRLSDEEWQRLSAWTGKLAEAAIYIDDTPGISILELRAKARRAKSEFDIGLIVIDYLQLMTASDRTDNREQEIARISRSVKALAKELDIAIIACAQLSRAVESRTDKRPMLSDLRESGCLRESTRILRRDTGAWVSLGELYRSGAREIPIWTLDDRWRLVPGHITHVFSSGEKMVYRLSLRSGRQIDASANHPFRVLDGWRRLDALRPGDRIGVSRSYLGDPEHPEKMSDDRIILLGHLIGDGCYVARQPLHYTNADEACVALVEQSARAEFDVVPRRVRQETWQHLYLSAGYRLTHGRRNPVAAWLDELGIYGQRSGEKTVPEVIFRLPQRQVALFLKHLWTTDGCVFLDPDRGRCTIYYASKSRELVEQVRHLLLRFGINGRIKSSRKAHCDPGYQVYIYGRDEQIRFLKRIGVYGVKQDEADAAIRFLEAQTTNPNCDVVPKEVWERVRKAKDRLGVSWRAFAEALGMSYCGSTLFKHGVGRDRLARIAKIVSDETLSALAGSDVYWDEVVSVTEIGREEVFDATVPETHNFVAEDIFVHNSIEQDADVVMFLYRPEVYGIPDEEGNPQDGVAEIIIGKQRNGPTGSVFLTWVGDYGRFEEPEIYRDEPF